MLLVVSLLLPWRSKRPYGPSQHNLNIYGMNILWNCMMFSTAHYDSFSWMLLIYFTVSGHLSVRWFSVFCICLGLGGIFVLGWFSGSFSGFIIFGGFLQNSLLPEVFGTDPLSVLMMSITNNTQRELLGCEKSFLLIDTANMVLENVREMWTGWGSSYSLS